MFDKNEILQAHTLNLNLIGPTLPPFTLPTGATGSTGAAQGCLCDCCVFAMQDVLRQLIGQTVILTTIADVPNVAPRFIYLLLLP